MKVCPSVICCLVLTLWDGNTGLINAETFRGTEGGDITVNCSFSFSGSRRIFCKEPCEDKDILIETRDVRNQSGRYSIEYEEGTFPVKSTLLYVSIRHLTQSDSGRYRCVLDRFGPDGSVELEIRVRDAPITSKPTSVSSASTVTPTQSLRSTPSSASPEATKQPPQQQTTAAPGAAQTTTGPVLYVALTLVFMIMVLSVAVFMFCRKRAPNPKDPPVETDYADITEPKQVYEEVKEGRWSRPPPVTVSTVYASATFSKTNGVNTSEDYSLVTAPRSLHKTEDDSSRLTYAEVDFSKSTAAALSSAPGGGADNVIYSVPQVAVSSDGSHASSPLYSTVSLH